MKNPNHQDVQSTKQIASLLGGGALALAGLRRRGISGALLGLGGAALAYRAVSSQPLFSKGARHRSLRDTIRRGSDVTAAVTIQRPISEVYSFFREQRNLAGALPNVTRIETGEESDYRWTLNSSRRRLTFETAIIADEADRRLEWVALPGGDLAARGRFLFREAPADRGTEVVVRLQYSPVVAHPLQVLAPLFRRLTRAQMAHGLGKIKQQLEAGELTTNRMRREERPPEPVKERAEEERMPGLEQPGMEVSR